jgi:hypothetical protein
LSSGVSFLSWLDSLVPFGLCNPPKAIDMARQEVPD